MSKPRSVILPHRGVLTIGGDDRVTFLQGLLSNDVAKVSATQAVWAAMLTPQGKFLHDVFLIAEGDTILLETEREKLEEVRSRLAKYKLRAKVTLEVRPDLTVAVAFGGEPAPTAGVWFADPRLPQAGYRALLPADQAENLLAAAGCTPIALSEYDMHRMSLGLPDGSRDLMTEKTYLMEGGFDELHGIDFKKGCYVGQETTTRMKRRELTKKRLAPIAIDGPVPAAGTLVTLPDGTEVGEIRSTLAGIGLAVLKIDALEGTPLTAGAAKITPRKPDWMVLPDTSK